MARTWKVCRHGRALASDKGYEGFLFAGRLDLHALLSAKSSILEGGRRADRFELIILCRARGGSHESVIDLNKIGRLGLYALSGTIRSDTCLSPHFQTGALRQVQT